MPSTTPTQDELLRELDAIELLTMRLRRAQDEVKQRSAFLIGNYDRYAHERQLIEEGNLGSLDDLDPAGATVADYLAHTHAQLEAEYSALCWFTEAYEAIESGGPEKALPIPSELRDAAERFPNRPGQTIADLAKEAIEESERRVARDNRLTAMLNRMLVKEEAGDDN